MFVDAVRQSGELVDDVRRHGELVDVRRSREVRDVVHQHRRGGQRGGQAPTSGQGLQPDQISGREGEVPAAACVPTLRHALQFSLQDPHFIFKNYSLFVVFLPCEHALLASVGEFVVLCLQVFVAYILMEDENEL